MAAKPRILLLITNGQAADFLVVITAEPPLYFCFGTLTLNAPGITS